MAILTDINRSFRDMPSANYTLEIRSFSDLRKILKETDRKSYESETFEAGGYKWKLSLYPNGDGERNGEGHISMYLVIAETNALPHGWDVMANFTFFVYNHIHDKFLKVQDARKRPRHFNRLKTEWGFPQLITQSAFHDPSNGYLIRGRCIFGTEISLSCLGKGECLKPMRKFNARYTWKINLFSTLQEEFHYSEIFALAGLKWNLLLYPRGHSHGVGKYLSLFLCLEESKAPERVYAHIKLSILDQHNIKDWSITDHHVFTAAAGGRGSGWPRYISLRNLNDVSRGFVVNDTLIVEVRILKLSTLEIF